MVGTVLAPRKKDIALAFIMKRIVRTGTSPSLGEIAAELRVSSSRVKALVAQLEADGRIERRPGAQRALTVRDVAGTRAMLTSVVARLGWAVNGEPPLPQGHLPMLPALEHIPDIDWPGAHA